MQVRIAQMPELQIEKPVSRSRWFKVGALFSLALVLAVAVVSRFWPFRREAVLQLLEEASDSKVTLGSFHQTYFPRPGCVLERVFFQHNPKSGTSPLITVERIRIEGSFAGMFAKHVKIILVEGLHVLIPPLGSEHFKTPPRSSIVIDSLVADGAMLEIALRRVGSLPLKFAFAGFTISDVGGNGPASFRAKISNPEPPGEISTSGKFGPWNPDDVGKTPVSGEYHFEHADLAAFRGIRGVLESSGKYGGRLERIEVEGNTDVPLFAVTRSSHHTRLRTQFNAVVNAENGDVFLQNVGADFRDTSILAHGSIAGQPSQTGKSASLAIACKEGRIQDLLLLFIKSQQAPMSGIVSFQAKASLPSGEAPFLQKVAVEGDFGINAGSFTKSDTQRGVNSLSQGALGAKKDEDTNDDTDPRTVLSDLKGHVSLRGGVATLSDLSFGVPGASAQMQGTYNLISEAVDLHGTLKTEAEISKTSHGMKSLLLKMLDPLFKSRRRGYVAPVKITGTYDHPSFGLDLGKSTHTASSRGP